ncbi:MAG: PAS domain-containing protein [Bryobacteraceae bacterium]
MAVVIADPSGRLVRHNRALRELWGVPPETVSWEQYGEWVGFLPETGTRIEAAEWVMSRALLNGEIVKDQLVERQRFGSNERRFMLNNAAPVRDGKGKIIAGVVAATDITEQRRTEEAIREHDATIRALLETASQAILGADPSGRVRIVNKMAEQEFRYSRDELIGQPLENLLPDQLPSRSMEQVTEYTPVGRQRRIEAQQMLLTRRKDGSTFPVEVSLTFVETRDGVFSVAFVTDTTEREEGARVLRESEARFRQLADSMPRWSGRPVPTGM